MSWLVFATTSASSWCFHCRSLGCLSSPPSPFIVIARLDGRQYQASIHPHPRPLFTFLLLFLSSLSKLIPIPHANLFSCFLFSPPPLLLLPSPGSVPPSLPLSLSVLRSLSISISRSGSTVFQDRQHPHSHVNPALVSRFEVITHHRQSHPIIHIHMFISLHRHRPYTSLI